MTQVTRKLKRKTARASEKRTKDYLDHPATRREVLRACEKLIQRYHAKYHETRTMKARRIIRSGLSWVFSLKHEAEGK